MSINLNPHRYLASHPPVSLDQLSSIMDPFGHVPTRLRLLVSTYQRPSGSSLNRSCYPPKLSKAPCALPKTTHGVTILGLTACLSLVHAPLGNTVEQTFCAPSCTSPKLMDAGTIFSLRHGAPIPVPTVPLDALTCDHCSKMALAVS
jgi:hypothetical protein